MIWNDARTEFLKWIAAGRDPILVDLPVEPEKHEFYVFDRLTYQNHIKMHVLHALWLRYSNETH
jgi:hypothetical protein